MGGKTYQTCCTALFEEPKPDMELIKFIAYQQEICPTTGKLHFQTYCIFKKKLSIKAAQKALGVPKCHIEPRYGEHKEALDYVKKSETAIDGTFVTLGSYKETEKEQNKNAIKNIVDQIDSGEYNNFTTRQILLHGNKIKNAICYNIEKNVPNWRNVNTHIIFGNSGCGKSKYFHEIFNELLYCHNAKKGQNLFVDNYLGQTNLLLDDFYGNIEFDELLRWLDGYKLQLNCKGGYTYANWYNVGITSNEAPHRWYNKTEKQFIPLFRRINKITFKYDDFEYTWDSYKEYFNFVRVLDEIDIYFTQDDFELIVDKLKKHYSLSKK